MRFLCYRRTSWRCVPDTVVAREVRGSHRRRGKRQLTGVSLPRRQLSGVQLEPGAGAQRRQEGAALERVVQRDQPEPWLGQEGQVCPEPQGQQEAEEAAADVSGSRSSRSRDSTEQCRVCLALRVSEAGVLNASCLNWWFYCTSPRDQ